MCDHRGISCSSCSCTTGSTRPCHQGNELYTTFWYNVCKLGLLCLYFILYRDQDQELRFRNCNTMHVHIHFFSHLSIYLPIHIPVPCRLGAKSDEVEELRSRLTGIIKAKKAEQIEYEVNNCLIMSCFCTCYLHY